MLNTRNKILLAILLLLLSILYTGGMPVESPKAENSEAIKVLPDNIVVKRTDPRVEILSDYFTRHNSPLRNHAKDFIEAADKYRVDWKLVPAISGVESTFGKRSTGFNAWGWGIYGNQALGFNSWKHGIFTVTEGLKRNYIDRGLTNPYAMNRVYAASPAWGGKVSYFMDDIEKFAGEYEVNEIEVAESQDRTASAEQALEK